MTRNECFVWSVVTKRDASNKDKDKVLRYWNEGVCACESSRDNLQSTRRIRTGVRKKSGMVLAYGINLDFYEHLLAFMEEDYVICSVDMAIMAYTGHGAFLSIDER